MYLIIFTPSNSPRVWLKKSHGLQLDVFMVAVKFLYLSFKHFFQNIFVEEELFIPHILIKISSSSLPPRSCLSLHLPNSTYFLSFSLENKETNMETHQPIKTRIANRQINKQTTQTHTQQDPQDTHTNRTHKTQNQKQARDE